MDALGGGHFRAHTGGWHVGEVDQRSAQGPAKDMKRGVGGGLHLFALKIHGGGATCERMLCPRHNVSAFYSRSNFGTELARLWS